MKSLPFSGDPASAAFPPMRPAKPVPLFQCDECGAVSRPGTNQLVHKPGCSFTDPATPPPPFHVVSDRAPEPADKPMTAESLAEIRRNLALSKLALGPMWVHQVERLVAEVERLRAELDAAVAYLAEIDQHADKSKAQILLGVISERDAEITRLRARLADTGATP